MKKVGMSDEKKIMNEMKDRTEEGRRRKQSTDGRRGGGRDGEKEVKREGGTEES